MNEVALDNLDDDQLVTFASQPLVNAVLQQCPYGCRNETSHSRNVGGHKVTCPYKPENIILALSKRLNRANEQIEELTEGF